MPVGVIIGASSGIGFQIARDLSKKGYTLGLVARRESLLRELASVLPTTSVAAPAYGASKAFRSNYLEALHCRLARLPGSLRVTDVLPGFVDTRMAQSDAKFWVASPEKAARQIVDAIVAKRRIVYVTKRWRLIGWLMKLVPVRIWSRFQ